MRRFSRGLIVAVFCLCVMAGCGEAKFDGSSSAAAAKSFTAMTSGMTDQQRQVFMARATTVSSVMNGNVKEAPTADTMWRGIHGMTKAQIEAKADEIIPKKTATPAK